MFFPKAMSELELIVPSKDLLGVMKVISGHGVFHQTDSNYPQLNAAGGAPNTWQERAAAYSALERRVQAVMQALGIEEGRPPSTDFRDVVEMEAVTPTLERIEGEVKATTDQLADSQRRTDEIQSTLRQLEPVAGIELDLAALRKSHFMISMLGLMPAANVGRLQTSLARVPHAFLILRQDSQKPVVWLAGTQSNADVIERAARSAYLEPLTLPDSHEGTPNQIIDSLNRELGDLRQRVEQLKARLAELTRTDREELLTLLWEIHASRTLTEAIVRFGQLRHTYVMVGWVPTDELETLTRRVKQASRETLIETIPTSRHGDNRNIPVALQNSRLLRPFQMLVTTYARPRYGELDPTWLIALTFPLLFGAMFGDVGHGLVLTIFGLLISSGKVKQLKSLASLGLLITICGISATIFGFLYGSFFGFEHAIPTLWIKPSDDPLTILGIAVGAGVVLLTLGFLIGIFNAVVSRDWPHLIFGHNGIAGFLLYWSALTAIAGSAKFIPLPPQPSIILAGVAAFMIMFADFFIRLMEGDRPLIEGGIFVFLFQGFMELFEAVLTFLSNTLSYIRVGAFAIAHGVLSVVMFLLAGLLDPHLGILYWLVVGVGTVIIVGFEGLIVGIQVMRLSYYEFFSKFFTGGGMRFEPLTLAPTKEQS
ncbi:MAG TPA: V-type ATPase 116kDa subunit family protein [Anaerolineales bacterium]|nr:V-type ATPase 116kDa subunit family protein [Anaerolineales bacterium]